MDGQSNSPIESLAIYAESDFTRLQANRNVHAIIAMVYSGLRANPVEIKLLNYVLRIKRIWHAASNFSDNTNHTGHSSLIENMVYINYLYQ